MFYCLRCPPNPAPRQNARDGINLRPSTFTPANDRMTDEAASTVTRTPGKTFLLHSPVAVNQKSCGGPWAHPGYCSVAC